MTEGADPSDSSVDDANETLEKFDVISEGVPQFREPPTFVEWFGATLATRLLGVICTLAVGFMLAWWFTRPSFAEVHELLGQQATPKELLETLQSLRKEHFDQFREIFQLVVLSGLVPLFTLLAGYAFGARQKEKPE